MFNTTCNSTLEEMRITGEEKIVGPLTFHDLAVTISGCTTALAIAISLYLVFRHATNYTKPREQRQIIRILLMVPIYSASSFLSIYYYRHAVYFQVICDCYEAFAISSFFSLMCHYIAPDLHEQKAYFRSMRPIKDWIAPVNWFAKCCGGQKGIWRIPKSGLTWFNIIWIGIYHYCFIRVAMTIAAVVTQKFDRYCESSNSPVFAHIWVVVIESVAVTIAMYCLIQFYSQHKKPLAEHKPLLKVLAIKLVIFLSFWQSAAISVGTSTIQIIEANEIIAYPDIKVGIPSLLLCVEMSLFALMHLWAFPYAPYVPGAPAIYYPPIDGLPRLENKHGPSQGGRFGLKALRDALNIWDVIKAFGRGIRWLFVGVRHRHEDPSYSPNRENVSYPMKSYSGDSVGGPLTPRAVSTDHLPITAEYRPSISSAGEGGNAQVPADMTQLNPGDGRGRMAEGEERAGLMQHAQYMGSPPQRVASPYQDRNRHDYIESPTAYDGDLSVPQNPFMPRPYSPGAEEARLAHTPEYAGYATQLSHTPYGQQMGHSPYESRPDAGPRTDTQMKFGNALWGDQQRPPGR